MANATLGSVNYAGVGVLTGAAQWVEKYEIGEPEYEKVFFAAPGVDGQGVKRYGFRGLPISLECWYIGTSEAAVIALYCSDMASLATGSFTAVLGNTFLFCELVKSKMIDPPTMTGFGTYLAKVTIEISQKRLS